MKLSRLQVYFPWLILALAAFFRLYRFSELFHYSLDEEFWSYLIERIIRYHDLPIVGGEISSTKIFTGPLFVYLHVPLFWLSHLQPLIGGYFWALVGVLTTGILYWFTKSRFSKPAGLLAAFFYASSFSMALYDRRFWNVSPIPLVALISAWFILEAVRGKRNRLIWLAFILSFGLQSHFSTVAVLVAVGIVWLTQLAPKLKRDKALLKESILAAGIFILLNLGPLVVFDLRHDFWHVKALEALPQQLLVPKEEGSNADALGIVTNIARSLGSLVYVGNQPNVTFEMTHCPAVIETKSQPPWFVQGLGLAVLVGMILVSLKQVRQPLAQFTLGLVLVNILGLFVYRERVFPYHFAPIMPFFFLFIGRVGAWLGRCLSWLVVVFASGLFLWLNLQSLLTAQSHSGFTFKQAVAEIITQKTQGQTVAVEFLPSCEVYGYRYLFTAMGKPIAKSWIDYVLGWLYPEELAASADTQVTVVIDDPGLTKEAEQQKGFLDEAAREKVELPPATIFFSSPEQTDNNTTPS